MEVLNQSNIPFGDGVKTVIESEITEYLSKRLTLRGVVDFRGEYTFDTDAIATKNLKPISSDNGVEISIREPIKMVEVRKRFTIPKSVIEDIKRGKSDFDNKSLTKASNEFAKVENEIILNGCSDANIKGILPSIENKLSANNATELLKCIAKSIGVFNENFVDGAFKLIISSNTLANLYTESFNGLSIKERVDEILGAGAIVISQDIGDYKALMLSQRGGDFEFYSGLDVSLGFDGETSDSVEMFLLETLAFRVITPEAAILIEIKG
ncbi:MAG: encapsulin [Campylobacterales bacterium]|nr:encapsulin [Campylobacterales bacterium]